LGACASTPDEVDEVPSAEGYFQEGMRVLEGRRILLIFRDVNYPRAIELFQEVIDNYPYSEFATLAELKIADVYFEQERFEEAGSYYQDFVELHPTHERVDYALYRQGLSAHERVKSADRDQTATKDAIEQFKAGGREDLAAREQGQIDLCKAYQPEQLGEAEIEALVDEVIQQTGAESKRDTGKVMKELMPRVKGKADGKLVSAIVGRKLG